MGRPDRGNFVMRDGHEYLQSRKKLGNKVTKYKGLLMDLHAALDLHIARTLLVSASFGIADQRKISSQSNLDAKLSFQDWFRVLVGLSTGIEDSGAGLNRLKS